METNQVFVVAVRPRDTDRAVVEEALARVPGLEPEVSAVLVEVLPQWSCSDLDELGRTRIGRLLAQGLPWRTAIQEVACQCMKLVEEQLGRPLPDSAMWGFVEVEAMRFGVLREHVAQWVVRTRIRSKFPVGVQVKFRVQPNGVEHDGEIVAVLDQQGELEIHSPALGHVRERGQGKAVSALVPLELCRGAVQHN